MNNINVLINQPAAEKVLDPKICLAWVIEVNTAYREVHRPGEQAQDIVNLKLCVSFWRSRLLDRLLNRPPAWAALQQDYVLLILCAINIHLSPDQQRLAGVLLNAAGLAELLANQGIASDDYPEFNHAAGPGVDLDIVANRGSSAPYKKWRENESFGRYQFEEEGVRFRGVSFRPGDVLLANVNVDGNGVYTALSEPRSFSSHSGFFAIFEHDGKRLPVVVETFEKGVRPVPLSIFLGPRFSSYVEIYRHTDYTPEHAPGSNHSAAGFIDSVLAYNFNSEELDPRYMSCTAIGRSMHEAVKLKPAQRKSELGHAQVQSNLAKLGFHHFDYFGPVDFLLNDCFEFVGSVDNNQVEHLLARELIDQEFKKQFSGNSLIPEKFPFPYKINLWGVRQMRKRSLLGRLISRLEGFTADTLPKGPDELLAVILLLEKQTGKAIALTRSTVAKVLEELEQLDMDAFMLDARIQHAVQTNLKLPWLQSA